MKWHVKWSAPSFPTLKSPLEIQVVKAPEPPTRVRVEIWESDAQKFEVDDYDDKKLPQEEDDLVAKFEGKLVPHPTRAHGFLFEDLDGKPELAAPQGSDHVFIRFEGEDAKTKHNCPIPPTGQEPQADTDGEFYELYFLIFDADAGPGAKPLVRSSTHFVRRRTDVLLAVEPLNQDSANLNNNPIGKRILERFHPGGGAADRNWGNVMLQVRGKALSVNMTSSGCSYTTMTMIARYLRIPKPGTPEGAAPEDIEWETLFDRTAGKSLKAENAPWEKTKKFKKIPRADEIEGLAKKLKKELGAGWRKKAKAADPAVMAEPPATDPQRPVKDLVTRRKTVPSQWFVPRLIWWIRQGDGNGVDPEKNFLRGQMRWRTFPKGGGEEMLDMVDGSGKPIFRYGFPNETSNGFSRTKDSLLFPPNQSLTPKLYSGLGIKSTTRSLKKGDKNWPDFVVKQLRRGLPVLAHFKSGRFIRDGADPGGHYILIVGFRTVNGRKRFIVNDPAGAKKLQYECRFEDELTPSEGFFDQVTGGSIGIAVLDPSQKKKNRVVKEGSISLKAESVGQTQTIEVTDAAGIQHKVELKFDVDYWRESNFILGNLKVDVKYTEDDVVLHEAKETTFTLKQRNRNQKKGTGSFSGSLVIKISDTRSLAIAIKPSITRTKGPLPRKPWEGQSNTLVERRRQDTMGAMTVFEPTKGWHKGAGRFLEFDGRVATPAP